MYVCEFGRDFVLLRLRRRWTRSTRRMWSRAGTSTRPCGRWGRATQRGGSISSRTCKLRTILSGPVLSCWSPQKHFTVTIINNIPPKLLSLRATECEWYIQVNPCKKQNKARNRNRPKSFNQLDYVLQLFFQSTCKAQLPHNRSEQACQVKWSNEVAMNPMNILYSVCMWFVFVHLHKSREYRVLWSQSVKPSFNPSAVWYMSWTYSLDMFQEISSNVYPPKSKAKTPSDQYQARFNPWLEIIFLLIYIFVLNAAEYMKAWIKWD